MLCTRSSQDCNHLVTSWLQLGQQDIANSCIFIMFTQIQKDCQKVASSVLRSAFLHFCFGHIHVNRRRILELSLGYAFCLHECDQSKMQKSRPKYRRGYFLTVFLDLCKHYKNAAVCNILLTTYNNAAM